MLQPDQTPNRQYTMSSGNVFANLGLPKSDDLLVKSELAPKIIEEIQRRRLTQTQAALLGVEPTTIPCRTGQRFGASGESSCQIFLTQYASNSSRQDSSQFGKPRAVDARATAVTSRWYRQGNILNVIPPCSVFRLRVAPALPAWPDRDACRSWAAATGDGVYATSKPVSLVARTPSAPLSIFLNAISTGSGSNRVCVKSRLLAVQVPG